MCRENLVSLCLRVSFFFSLKTLWFEKYTIFFNDENFSMLRKYIFFSRRRIQVTSTNDVSSEVVITSWYKKKIKKKFQNCYIPWMIGYLPRKCSNIAFYGDFILALHQIATHRMYAASFYTYSINVIER